MKCETFSRFWIPDGDQSVYRAVKYWQQYPQSFFVPILFCHHLQHRKQTVVETPPVQPLTSDKYSLFAVTSLQQIQRLHQSRIFPIFCLSHFVISQGECKVLPVFELSASFSASYNSVKNVFIRMKLLNTVPQTHFVTDWIPFLTLPTASLSSSSSTDSPSIFFRIIQPFRDIMEGTRDSLSIHRLYDIYLKLPAIHEPIETAVRMSLLELIRMFLCLAIFGWLPAYIQFAVLLFFDTVSLLTLGIIHSFAIKDMYSVLKSKQKVPSTTIFWNVFARSAEEIVRILFFAFLIAWIKWQPPSPGMVVLLSFCDTLLLFEYWFGLHGHVPLELRFGFYESHFFYMIGFGFLTTQACVYASSYAYPLQLFFLPWLGCLMSQTNRVSPMKLQRWTRPSVLLYPFFFAFLWMFNKVVRLVLFLWNPVDYMLNLSVRLIYFIWKRPTCMAFFVTSMIPMYMYYHDFFKKKQ
jgi:hypothetical protein